MIHIVNQPPHFSTSVSSVECSYATLYQNLHIVATIRKAARQEVAKGCRKAQAIVFVGQALPCLAFRYVQQLFRLVLAPQSLHNCNAA